MDEMLLPSAKLVILPCLEGFNTKKERQRIPEVSLAVYESWFCLVHNLCMDRESLMDRES